MAAYGLLARAIGTRVLLPALTKTKGAEKFVSRQIGRVFSRYRQTKKGAFVRPGTKGFTPRKVVERRGRIIYNTALTAPVAKDAYSAVKRSGARNTNLNKSTSSPISRTVIKGLGAPSQPYYKDRKAK